MKFIPLQDFQVHPDFQDFRQLPPHLFLNKNKIIALFLNYPGDRCSSKGSPAGPAGPAAPIKRLQGTKYINIQVDVDYINFIIIPGVPAGPAGPVAPGSPSSPPSPGIPGNPGTPPAPEAPLEPDDPGRPGILSTITFRLIYVIIYLRLKLDFTLQRRQHQPSRPFLVFLRVQEGLI